ncbi:MAG: alanine dehydrogenase [Natronospirillum sp.]
MYVGVPKEIKNHEYRVGLTPAGVRELTVAGHQVCVETQAGAAIGFSNEDYEVAGALIVQHASDVFERAEMIIKVKEPQADERALLRPHHILFTYLHLAPDEPQLQGLIASGATCIAYETVTDEQGRLPLLAPMSEVAGRMAVQAGAHCLEKSMGGSGILLGGVPGVEPAHVTILGGGVVGQNALAMAVGLGAQVTVLDRNMDVLRRLDQVYGNRITTLFSTREALEKCVVHADLVIGAVLIPGAAAPKLITHEMIKTMAEGSVVVDVAIDQGGCMETSKPTTHSAPTYVVDGVVHYCVANMPGGVARTATQALNNATLPFVMQLANKGAKKALLDNEHLQNGLNVCRGVVTYAEVASARGVPYRAALEVLNEW